MKSSKLILLFVVGSVLFSCGKKEGQSDYEVVKSGDKPINKDWKSLTEEDFSISYPDHWELDQSGEMGTKFMIFSPLSSRKDKFKENVNLIVENLPSSGIGLDEYVEASKKFFEANMTNGKVLESKIASEKGGNCQYSTSVAKQGQNDLKFRQKIILKGNKAYVVTFTATESSFDDYVGDGNSMLESFHLN